jgi:3-oxoacyl-[acyl-carrier-protein] synthase-1
VSGRRGYPVTAWSAVNGLGISSSEVFAALRRGERGLSAPPPGTPLTTLCGTVADLPPLGGALEGLDSRNNRFVARALEELTEPLAAARERWGVARIGICVGSSTAAMDEIESAYSGFARSGEAPSAFDIFQRGSNAGLVDALRSISGLEGGPATIISNACASSGKAFASAKRWLESDLVDAVLVGGADTLCQLTLRGFGSLGLLSAVPTRPFSAERNGINIGEGAAFALVEREGDGPRLLGTGESADAHHMTRPDPEGMGARAAIEAALADAAVDRSEVDYVNAHGTGTRFNDAMEAVAIRASLGAEADPIVVSTKGYVGHMLGAAGATEAVFVLESLAHGWIPGSVGADPVDLEISLNVPTKCSEVSARVAISNSFAFGGSNVSVVFGAPE